MFIFLVCSAKVSCFYCCSHFLFWWPAVLEVCCQLSIMDYHLVQAFSKIESLVEAQSSDHFNHFFFSQSDAQSSLLGCLEPLAWTCRCGVACPRSLRLVWMFRISAAGLVLRVDAPVQEYLSFLGRSDFTSLFAGRFPANGFLASVTQKSLRTSLFVLCKLQQSSWLR